MNGDQLRNAYQAFFLKSEAGAEFMKSLELIIAHNHEEAELRPELSRDYVQRAKGAREVKAHIESVTTEISKGRVIKE